LHDINTAVGVRVCESGPRQTVRLRYRETVFKDLYISDTIRLACA
jgi:hypothetical protein